MIKEALLYEPLPGGRVKCTACARYCQIGEGKIGLCGIRQNINGKLHLLVYGKIIAGHIDPIEKKPVVHYMPGTKIFSIATTGCNWLCHPAGTRILLADGTKKNVEDMRPGDTVWSYDVGNGLRITPNVVTHVGWRKARPYRVEYGRSGQELLLTAEHPVLTQTGWKAVAELKPGDQLLRVWHHNTEAWRSHRNRTLITAEFTCARCNTHVQGIATWNRHRGACYTNDYAMPQALRERHRVRMRASNPMHDELAVRRMVVSQRNRFLVDATHGWHRNIARLRSWLHRHPSEGQRVLYGLLRELGVPFESEYRIPIERPWPGARSCYYADAAVLQARLDIEVDSWWHYHSPQVAESDHIRDATLEANGWRVLRLPGQLLYRHPEEAKRLVQENLAPVLRHNAKSWVEVHSVVPMREDVTVYSFECAPNHTYVADGVLMHNCHYCQNYDISQRRKVEGEDVTPEEVVALTSKYGCQGIAYTYNQPTIFMEFARDVGVIARRKGIINIFVSNGYDTPDTVGMMNEFLDCITVDFKGNGETNFLRRYVGVPNAEPIYQTLQELRDKTKVHVEITDLVIPEIGDNVEEATKLSKWVYDNLGPDTPIHFLRFHPDYKLIHLPWTPVETLEKHHAAAKKAGLHFVYVGNVPGHPLEHTYCPGCGAVAVERFGFDITGWHLDRQNRCVRCGYHLPIVGTLAKTVVENRFLPVIN